MPLYTVTFLDDEGDPFGFETFTADGDDAARDYAFQILKQPVGSGHVIHDGSRLVRARSVGSGASRHNFRFAGVTWLCSRSLRSSCSRSDCDGVCRC